MWHGALVYYLFTSLCLTFVIGMGTIHAWESFGDGAAPDIQAVAKGLGGGYKSLFFLLQPR